VCVVVRVRVNCDYCYYSMKCVCVVVSVRVNCDYCYYSMKCVCCREG